MTMAINFNWDAATWCGLGDLTFSNERSPTMVIDLTDSPPRERPHQRPTDPRNRHPPRTFNRDAATQGPQASATASDDDTTTDTALPPSPVKRSINYDTPSKKPRTASVCLAVAKHQWDDGKWRLVPPHWTFPVTTLPMLWSYWFHGYPDDYIGPFRHFSDDDFPDRDSASYKRFRDASIVMGAFVGVALAYERTTVEAIEALTSFDLSRFLPYVFSYIFPDKELTLTKPISAYLTKNADSDSDDALVVFPAKLTCQALWRQWFLGKPTPLCRVEAADWSSPECNARRHQAHRLMSLLMSAAVALDVVPTKRSICNLDAAALDDVMEAAFVVLVAQAADPAINAMTKDTIADDLLPCLDMLPRLQSPPSAPLPPLDAHAEAFSIQEFWLLWFRGGCLTHGVPYRRVRRWTDSNKTRDIMYHLSNQAVEAKLPGVPTVASLDMQSPSFLQNVLAQTLDRLRAKYLPEEGPSIQPTATMRQLWHVLFNLPLSPEDDAEADCTLTTQNAGGVKPDPDATAPPARALPPLTLRTMWMFWWNGDGTGGPGYRHRNWTSDGRTAAAAYLMYKLGQCAVALKSVPSLDALEMLDRDTLRQVLPMARDQLRATLPGRPSLSLNEQCEPLHHVVATVRAAAGEDGARGCVDSE